MSEPASSEWVEVWGIRIRVALRARYAWCWGDGQDYMGRFRLMVTLMSRVRVRVYRNIYRSAIDHRSKETDIHYQET